MATTLNQTPNPSLAPVTPVAAPLAGYGRGRPSSSASSLHPSLPASRTQSQVQGYGECWKCGGDHNVTVCPGSQTPITQDTNIAAGMSNVSLGGFAGRAQQGSRQSNVGPAPTTGFGLPVGSVLPTQGQNMGGPNRDGGFRRGEGDGSGCHRCGQPGHIARECSNPRLCYQCNQPGHEANNCPNPSTRAGSSARPGPSKYTPATTATEQLFTMPKITPGENFNVQFHIPVKVTGERIVPHKTTFTDMGLLRALQVNIKKNGYETPTPVQQYCIPHIMQNIDIASCAQTGSGKTAAFLLPIINALLLEPCGQQLTSNLAEPRALIIAPVRELVVQIYEEARKFAAGTNLEDQICATYGGTSVDWNRQLITTKETQIIVATVGRLKQYITDGYISLKRLRFVVLDEADRMLSYGFEHDIRAIISHDDMPMSGKRLTMMFSATFPVEIQTLAKDFFRTGYSFVAVGEIGAANHDVTQKVIAVNKAEKMDKIVDLVRDFLNTPEAKQLQPDDKIIFRKKVLIFTERKRTTDTLASFLCRSDLPATSINGDREQRQREEALMDLRKGDVGVLVATDVAARGLDIPLVDWVINYDLPNDISQYVHRVGRTGRVGNRGNALSFFDRDVDMDIAHSLVDILAEAQQDMPDFLQRLAGKGTGSYANVNTMGTGAANGGFPASATGFPASATGFPQNGASAQSSVTFPGDEKSAAN